MKQHALIGLVLLFLASCATPGNQPEAEISAAASTSEQTSLQVINFPFEGIRPKAEQVIVTNNESTEHTTARGTHVSVPDGVFCDKDGKAISRKVIMEVYEYFDAADILVSGIPMVWDSAGTMIDFQSAGMIEVRATCDNEPVYVAANKSIKVAIESESADDNYGQFYLDEQGGNWDYMNSGEMEVSSVEGQSTTNAPAMTTKPQRPPSAFDEKAYTFDLNINYEKFPELNKLNNVMWQYAGNSDETDPRKSDILKNVNWSSILLTKNEEAGKYDLSLSDHSDHEFSTIVRPVLRGKALKEANALFEKQMAEFEGTMKKRKVEHERVGREQNIKRIFSVNKMGVYNYDRQWHKKDAVPLTADFNFGASVDKSVNSMTVFLITGKGMSVIKYPEMDWNKFAYAPSDDNKLLVVLPGDEIGYYTQQKFNVMNHDELRAQDKPSHEFVLAHKAQVKSLEELKAFMADM